MKKKISRVLGSLLALTLIASLGFVSLPASAFDGGSPELEVTITQPVEGAEYEFGDTYNVVAKVTNNGDRTARHVMACIDWEPDDAELVEGDNECKYLGFISPGSTQDAQWTLLCTGPSHPLTIRVEADGVYDHVEVQQLGDPGIEILVISPEPETKVGVCQDFDVVANIYNTGLEPLEDVVTEFSIEGNASLVSGPVYDWPGPAGYLDKKEKAKVTWTFHCDDADEVTNDNETPADPRDDTVDFTDIYVSANGTGTSTGELVTSHAMPLPIHQKYLTVEILRPEDGTRVNVCRQFYVSAQITNHYDKTIQSGGSATIYLDGNAEIYPPPDKSQILPAIPAGGKIEIPLPWHVHCTYEGAVTIDVVASVIAADGNTLINYDSITIGQDDPAELVVELAVEEKCVGISNEYEIYGAIWNLGDEVAKDVTATISITGPSELIGDQKVTIEFPYILGGSNAGFYWVLHCTGPGDVKIDVTAAGTGANTDEAIIEESYGYKDPVPDSVVIHQMPLTVAITAPQGGETYSFCQTFSVEAELVNPSTDVNLGPVVVQLLIDGPAHVTCGESIKKTIPTVNAGDTQQVAWTVHCQGSGDVNFRVFAETYWKWDPEGEPQHQYTVSPAVFVHQEWATDLDVEILSPDHELYQQTAVATSQDFSVTAVVTNEGEADSLDTEVTICAVDGASVLPPPDATIELGTLAGGESRVVTWTLHCDESGHQPIFVCAKGTDENSNDRKCAFDWSYVYQYAAAHLEIEIIDYPEGPVLTSTEFPITARITNTGEADAWEVDAIIDIFPAGSAKVTKGGYTQEVGTIPGHGSPDNYKDVTWMVHCKVPSEATITVTAEGYDEYGWHFKEQTIYASHSVGYFEGYYCGGFEGWYGGFYGGFFCGGYEGSYSGTYAGEYQGSYEGEYEGSYSGSYEGSYSGSYEGEYDGSFSGEVDIAIDGSMSGEFVGHIDGSVSGFIEGCAVDGDFSGDVNGEVDITITGTVTGTFEGEFSGGFSGEFDGEFDGEFEGEFDGSFEGEFDGSFEGEFSGSFSGTFGGVFMGMFGGYFNGRFGGMFEGEFELYSITWPITFYKLFPLPGNPIQERFIEPDSVTVKQVESGGLDLAIVKFADNLSPDVGERVNFTIRVTNNGPTDASGVVVKESLPDGLSGWNVEGITQGSYADGTWTIGNMVAGTSATLMLSAQVDSDETITNTATVSCDQPDGTPWNDSASVTLNLSSVEIELDAGYNLVSLPLIADDESIEAVLADVLENLDVVWAYDACTGEWTNYATTGPAGELTVMKDGPGYWIVMNDSDTMVVTGYVLPLPPELPPSYDVCPGWNLIGFKSVHPRLASDYLKAIDGKYTVIYCYVNGTFYIVLPNEYLQPGLGYWIAVINPGTIFP